MAYRHHHYNTDDFPTFVCHHGNWDIYADERGYCASIPTEAAAAIGCKATHFGDLAYVRATLGVETPTGPAPLSNRQQGSRSGYAKRRVGA